MDLEIVVPSTGILQYVLSGHRKKEVTLRSEVGRSVVNRHPALARDMASFACIHEVWVSTEKMIT